MGADGFCDNCPLGPSAGAECLDHADRKTRLVLLAASQVPVQCHKIISPEQADEATALLYAGKDWRLDLKVTHPCYGTVMNTEKA